MEGLNFLKTEREVPLSHYKIMRSHIIRKSCFKDSNRIDTVKPGTLLGFTDSKGNFIDINKKNSK